MQPQTLFNLVRMTTPTTGVGTLSLGVAVSGFLTFVQASVPDQQTVSYSISDGANSEGGRGVYSLAAQTLTRSSILASTNGGTAINLSGSAQVAITPLAQDILLQNQTEIRSDAGAVAVPILQILQRCPRPQDFGPIGQADDSLTWNAFIAALANGRYEGVIDSATTITIGSAAGGAIFNSVNGCILSGGGESSKIIVGANQTGLTIGSSDYLKIRDLHFVGANNTNSNLLALAKTAASATTFYTLDNIIFDGGFNQLTIGDSVFEGLVNNCKFIGAGNFACEIAPPDQSFANLQRIVNCDFIGFVNGIHATNFANLIIDKCQFERDSVIAGAGFPVYADTLDNLVVRDSYFEDWCNIQAIATGPNARQVSINGNYFALNQSTGNNSNVGMYTAQNNVQRVSVKDNMLTSFGTIGTMLNFANSTYITCRDNFFNPNTAAIGIASGIGPTIDIGGNDPGTGTYTTTFCQARPNQKQAVCHGSYNTTTSALLEGFNVGSVVRNSAGNISVTFATPLSDANYAVVCTSVLASTLVIGRCVTKNTSGMVLDIINASVAETDAIIDFVVFGNLQS